VILEEYADGLHFISGFCAQFEISAVFTLKDDVAAIDDKHIINKKINKLYKLISALHETKIKKTKKLIPVIYKKYIALGIVLGFDLDAIKIAYAKKHEINVKRQESNY
jgi:dimeric dUTPase (all-alpha-NTP-PPase superfamily)